MDIMINSLVAQLQGREMSLMQRADALIEFNKLCDYVNELEDQLKTLKVDEGSNCLDVELQNELEEFGKTQVIKEPTKKRF